MAKTAAAHAAKAHEFIKNYWTEHNDAKISEVAEATEKAKLKGSWTEKTLLAKCQSIKKELGLVKSPTGDHAASKTSTNVSVR